MTPSTPEARQSLQTLAVRFGVALLATFVAFLFAIIIRPYFPDVPLFPFLFAVIISGWYGGYAAAIVSLALAIFLDATQLSPAMEASLGPRAIVFIAGAVIASRMGSGMREAQAAAETRAAETAFLLRQLEEQTEERQRLYSAEREARTRAEAAERRFRFLAAAGSQISAAAVRGNPLNVLCEAILEAFGDWSILFCGPHDDEPIALHRDASRTADVERLAQQLRAGGTGPMQSVIATAESRLVNRMPEETDPLFSALETRSWISVPVAGEGGNHGVLLVGSARLLKHEDHSLAEELARDAAGAVQTAQLIVASREADRAKSDFLAVMSHELRTPLTAIIGYTDLLEGGVTGPINDKQRVQLARVGSSAWRLLGLIDEVLTYTKLQLGLAETHRVAVPLADLIADALHDVARAVEGKPVRLHSEVEPIVIETDPFKLRHILDALLGNAVKFTHEGDVWVRAARRSYQLVIEVEDTGIGIPDGDFARIFEPFTQVEDPLTRSFGGTGLGLAVTRRLARLLGGELDVRSNVGRGSTFTLYIPLHMPTAVADDPLHQQAG
jgi:signal transduction histidine kinase